MSVMQIKIKDRAFRRTVNRLDMKRQVPKIMRVFKVRMLRSVDVNFQRGGRDGGSVGTWEPLTDSTIAGRKKGQRAKATVLVETGNLRNSIAADIAGASLEVGSNVPYSIHHQEGKGRMHRPFLMVHDEDIDFLEDKILKALVG